MNNSLVSVPFRQTTVWKVARAIFAVVVFLHVLFAATQITVRWDRLYIDTVTGTREHRREWITGWHSTRTELSPIEERLAKAGASWKRDRVFLDGTYCAFLGNVTIYANGSSAEIYLFDFDAQSSWVDHSSDDEIREFVKTMESNDPAAQRTAIAGAWDKVIGLLDRQENTARTMSEPK